jgi:hypothetical protein
VVEGPGYAMSFVFRFSFQPLKLFAYRRCLSILVADASIPINEEFKQEELVMSNEGFTEIPKAFFAKLVRG